VLTESVNVAPVPTPTRLSAATPSPAVMAIFRFEKGIASPSI
jgi:hypothetical protein